jgi:C_GCAxxG_C_C family probable redox protein
LGGKEIGIMDDTAFKVFKLSASGFCCTQIIIKLALDAEEKENTDLIRAVNGLCRGLGGTQKTCGVLTGGIAVLGLYAGKGSETEYPKEAYAPMVAEFIKWFEEEFKSTECVDIIGVCSFTDENSNESYMLKCGDILLKSYQKLQEILAEYDYEFGSRE